jgi:DNA polymerase-4
MSRRVLHCDMDCFYAAIHMRDDPTLAGKPVLVGGRPGGRGVVAAASYEARRYGVRSAMPSTTAARLCPQAVFLPPDFPRYREESKRVFAIFRELTDRIQAVSIDEAYLDVSECLGRWGSATAIAEEIRRRVREERSLTVSVGVGPNKLIAKIASDFDKPDGLTVVRPERVRQFLQPLSVRVIPGIGPATAERLGRLGIRTVRDLVGWSESSLEERFGRHGRSLYRFARGIDERPVTESRQRKSLSSERTFAEDLTDLADIEREVDRLSERVARGLEAKQLTARTISLKVRYADFTTVTRSCTLTGATRQPDTLRERATALLAQTEAAERPVRLLGVGCSNLGPADGPVGDEGRAAGPRGQLPLFGPGGQEHAQQDSVLPRVSVSGP